MSRRCNSCARLTTWIQSWRPQPQPIEEKVEPAPTPPAGAITLEEFNRAIDELHARIDELQHPTTKMIEDFVYGRKPVLTRRTKNSTHDIRKEAPKPNLLDVYAASPWNATSEVWEPAYDSIPSRGLGYAEDQNKEL
jgi:hypothetical protein